MAAGAFPTGRIQRFQHREVLSAQLLQAGQLLAEIQVKVVALLGQRLLVERLQHWVVFS